MFYILNTSFVLWPTWPDKFISLIVTYQGFYPQSEPIVTPQSKDDRSFMCPSEYLVPSIGRTAPKPMVIEPFYNCPRVPCTSPGTWVDSPALAQNSSNWAPFGNEDLFGCDIDNQVRYNH